MNKKSIIICIVVAVLLAIPAGLYLALRSGVIHTKTYTAPDKAYTIQVPVNITPQQSTATSTNNGKEQKIQISSFTSEDGIGITIQTYLGKVPCDTVQKPNATLAGLPAVHDAIQQSWTLNTESASYYITYSYPGAQPRGPAQMTQPTTVPQAEQKKSLATVEQIITSFLPKTATPLVCP